MRVQVNVIFDLESEADRAAIVARLGGIFSAAHVETEVVPVGHHPSEARVMPLSGNGADEAPMRVGGAASAPAPDEAKAKDQAAANLKARQQAAANARAAKQSQQAQAKLNPPPPPDDLAGGTNGAADADADDDALGLNSPSMSPGEAKDAALALVREAYSAGHVAQVKALQKELGVAKFYDVDVTTGHAFYQRVMKLAHEVGIRR
jgi:hypothetical protein